MALDKVLKVLCENKKPIDVLTNGYQFIALDPSKFKGCNILLTTEVLNWQKCFIAQTAAKYPVL